MRKEGVRKGFTKKQMGTIIMILGIIVGISLILNVLFGIQVATILGPPAGMP
jgi:hypothetical protein